MAMTMNLDKFGAIIDGFLKDNPIQMLIELPEGTLEPVIRDNTEMGAVMQLYIILNTVEAIYEQMVKEMELEDTEDLANSICDLLKESMLGGK